MNIQWYPGHMTKAKRQMQEDIKLIDLVVELLDARAPLSSRNPDIDELGKNKHRLVLLNKSDMADNKKTALWQTYFESRGIKTLKIDARSKATLKSLNETVELICKDKIERDRRRGIKNRPIRAMVVGIPNVGKSTFINSYAGKAFTKTGNKPGVTKGKQWIRMGKMLELLDTPGILWPKFDDRLVGLRLAMIGSINDDILNMEELAMEAIAFLKGSYPGALSKRYGAEETHSDSEILREAALNRNCLKKGGDVDYLKGAKILLEELRNGKIGRFTFEVPEVPEVQEVPEDPEV